MSSKVGRLILSLAEDHFHREGEAVVRKYGIHSFSGVFPARGFKSAAADELFIPCGFTPGNRALIRIISIVLFEGIIVYCN